jgi:hypothetical protein
MNTDNTRWTTTDEALLSDPDYQKVITIIHELWNSGIIQRGNGHCYSMSDIISKLLKLNGIDCYLEECSLMILQKNPPELHLVGYPGTDVADPLDEIVTHVVCITKTDKPLLIDLSISNFIEGIPYVCEKITLSNEVEISNFEFDNCFFKYSRRSHVQVPLLHQQSIIDRIKTDRKIFSDISKINKILITLFVISSLNFIRGGVDFYQKYINQSNGFGPEPKTSIK